jgi:hypothetical protein
MNCGWWGLRTLALTGLSEPPALEAGVRERYSRTIAALGEDAFARLRALRCGLAGVGRLGGLLAWELARAGLARAVLVDPDIIEIGNLGESDYAAADVGQPKALALARRLGERHPELAVEAVPGSITEYRALHALSNCDMLFVTPDNAGARLAAHGMATLFNLAALDVGTGILHSGEFGLDLRVIWPGRCVLCAGGIARLVEGAQSLARVEAERAFHEGRNWQAERRGSLRSLNLLAAGLTLTTLADFVAERVRENGHWVQVRRGANDRMLFTYPPTPARRDTDCWCALAGRGEAGLGELAARLRALARSGQSTGQRAQDRPRR